MALRGMLERSNQVAHAFRRWPKAITESFETMTGIKPVNELHRHLVGRSRLSVTSGPMTKRADVTIEPDLMKGEIDEHADHWTFYLKVGDRVCYDYSRRSARRRMVIARGRDAAAKRAGPDHRPQWACSRASSFQGKARNRSWNLRKFFNDFSRAPACACAQSAVHSDSVVASYDWP